MIGKIYTINGEKILLFAEEEFEIPKELLLELVGPGTPQENPDIPCFYYPDFLSGILGKRSDEKILDTEGVRTWRDLCALEIAIKHKVCAKSSRVRKLILDKYNLINDAEFENNAESETNTGDNSVSSDTGTEQ